MTPDPSKRDLFHADAVVAARVARRGPTSDIDRLAAEIEKLSPSDRLRMAAELLEAKRPKLAHAIAERVVLELGAAMALAAGRGGDGGG